MDEAARQRLSQDLMQALKTPELAQRIRDMGVEPMPMTPDEFQAYAQRERAEWATVIERAGIRMD